MRLHFALILTTALLATSSAMAQAEASPAPPQAHLPAITVSTVTPRLLQDRVIATGLIAPVELVQVAPLIEGQPIETLLADIGDQVAAGQVLAVLSRSTLELQKSQLFASLAAAKASIAQAEAQMIEASAAADEAARVSARTKALREQGTYSQASAESAAANAAASAARVSMAMQSQQAAMAQMALVEAQIANLDLQLNRTEVKAPVAGEITARNAVVGAIASAAGQPMFTMIRDGALELTVDVAEVDLLRLAPGQTANLRLVGPGAAISGVIRRVEPTIDPATRLGRARITITEMDRVRSGMFAEADILISERDSIAVPVTAVGAGPEGNSVMVLQGGTVRKVAVTTGIRQGGWVEILNGLAGGDQVVTKAGAFVRDGDRITPVAAKE